MFDFLKYFNILGTEVELPKEEPAWKTTVITPVEEPEPIKPEPPPEVVSDWVTELVKRIDGDVYHFLRHEDIVLCVPLNGDTLLIKCYHPPHLCSGYLHQSNYDVQFYLEDVGYCEYNMGLTSLERSLIGAAIYRCHYRVADNIKKNFI